QPNLKRFVQRKAKLRILRGVDMQIDQPRQTIDAIWQMPGIAFITRTRRDHIGDHTININTDQDVVQHFDRIGRRGVKEGADDGTGGSWGSHNALVQAEFGPHNRSHWPAPRLSGNGPPHEVLSVPADRRSIARTARSNGQSWLLRSRSPWA